MPFRVLGGVLTFAERLVARRGKNGGATILRVFVMSVHILDSHVYVLRNLATVRRTVLASLPPNHHRPIRNDQLGVGNDVLLFNAETFDESKGAA